MNGALIASAIVTITEELLRDHRALSLLSSRVFLKALLRRQAVFISRQVIAHIPDQGRQVVTQN